MRYIYLINTLEQGTVERYVDLNNANAYLLD
ncbi:hypothetical protein HYQ50_2159 [Lactobacillus crispatus]|uniref:Uncharacterized protein n=1 Tax=Lactobacillus crispatus FB077-07 TaxID=883092 RepID=K1MHT4_9LACO|nr:hypothetical protein HMPREF9249_02489 [Lactobacillus crispatus FB077-07]MBI1711139.1 hypothetical protein [Lactobacillus crispatus]